MELMRAENQKVKNCFQQSGRKFVCKSGLELLSNKSCWLVKVWILSKNFIGSDWTRHVTDANVGARQTGGPLDGGA